MRFKIGVLDHLIGASRIGLAFLSVLILVGTLGGATAVAATSMATIPGSFAVTTDTDVGHFSSDSMTVDVVLAPSHQADLSALMTGLYDPMSSNYQHWLGKGEFVARFAPSADQVAAVTAYLQSGGLVVQPSSSPFLVRATGPSSAVEAAFNTSLHSYVNGKGISYFSNASAMQMPAGFAAGVLGVVGASNTVRMHSHVRRAAKSASQTSSCETPYVTEAQLVNAVVNGVGFPYGYGGGPGCNGLTPSQVNGIYSAPPFGAITQGWGVNFAVFELSAYQHSDIQTWATTFYGPFYSPRLVDVTVDGGPLAPVCPTGDTCPPNFNGYAGDIEVDADIEVTLAVAPWADALTVYNAPNDFTGQTELDEWSQIAADNAADVVSSSWSVCENDAGAGYAQAENVVFTQMAAQGQSVFGAEGDTGAFECIRSDGTTILNVLDPPAQPYVTSVGGTSMGNFNPGMNPFPQYPKKGTETVWNVDDLCNTSASEGGVPGLDWCALVGAGGGGNSQYWGRPSFQYGPGINNPYTTYGNGTTQCALAAVGTPCRETPDISANADEYTPYAEFCTANASTPFSACGFSAGQTPPGWFGIGGTSLSSPLVSAIFGDRDGFRHHRTGLASALIYRLYREDADDFFHDITGAKQSTNNNGFFPVTPGYDMATGVGTPIMFTLITGFTDW